ncbi:hypothetical protein S40285_07313 [Stachybotrys chlorohalonatus IBT 40285]|uniref:Uncharacterized protein n=1 Tax=Stachybotrys chlorohalonatus (strain IBT 40285) TaxID=1283841 RepID=A0A084QRJ7_STAC4|nr:hypothetical protein S40285_07313 [Stachybotrys chlorohalonata IBT 40285]
MPSSRRSSSSSSSYSSSSSASSRSRSSPHGVVSDDGTWVTTYTTLPKIRTNSLRFMSWAAGRPAHATGLKKKSRDVSDDQSYRSSRSNGSILGSDDDIRLYWVTGSESGSYQTMRPDLGGMRQSPFVAQQSPPVPVYGPPRPAAFVPPAQPVPPPVQANPPMRGGFVPQMPGPVPQGHSIPFANVKTGGPPRTAAPAYGRQPPPAFRVSARPPMA